MPDFKHTTVSMTLESIKSFDISLVQKGETFQTFPTKALKKEEIETREGCLPTMPETLEFDPHAYISPRYNVDINTK